LLHDHFIEPNLPSPIVDVRVSDGIKARVDFDIVSVDEEMFLANHVKEMPRTGEKGFRLIDFEPLPD